MMNILLDELPTSVNISGYDVPISTSYRTWIKFEQIINNCRMDNMQKLDAVIDLCFPDIEFTNLDARSQAVDHIIWFYRCGKEKRKDEDDGNADSDEPSFSYEHDAAYVYAAFMQTYHIDLAENNIHWWQFRALFEALPEDTMLIKIIGYRKAEVPQKASAETRQRIERMKQLYALPLDADQQEFKTDLEAILMNGGNPSVLLDGGIGHELRRDP